MISIGKYFLSTLLALGVLFQLETVSAVELKFLDLFLPKKDLSTRILGVNAFVNDPGFGPIGAQFREVRNTLGITHVRALFAWNDQVQSTPTSSPNFSFYDDIVRNIPRNGDVIVVLTGIPSWMKDSKNWINGDPRETFVQKWIVPVVSRYGSNRRIIGWQIWNEPNMDSNPDNQTLQVLDHPELYVSLLQKARQQIKRIAPRQKTIMAATTAIAQNFSETLQYNRDLKTAGIEAVTDIYAIHFYGKQIENIIRPDGVQDFLRSVTLPIWITETGAKGATKQEDYARRIIPYLTKTFPNIKRVYLYQFTERSPSSETYGLKYSIPKIGTSDLYKYLVRRRGN